MHTLPLQHNIEEQRRIAHQSQVFLSMTQNVFSSLRKFPHSLCPIVGFDVEDMNQLVRNITKVSVRGDDTGQIVAFHLQEAKALVQAEM